LPPLLQAPPAVGGDLGERKRGRLEEERSGGGDGAKARRQVKPRA